MNTVALFCFFLATFIVTDPFFSCSTVLFFCCFHFVAVILSGFRIGFQFRNRREFRCRVTIAVCLFIMIVFWYIRLDMAVSIRGVGVYFAEIIPQNR